MVTGSLMFGALLEAKTLGLIKILGNPEAEKPRRRVGIADRNVFSHPERFCACLQNGPKKKQIHL